MPFDTETNIYSLDDGIPKKKFHKKLRKFLLKYKFYKATWDEYAGLVFYATKESSNFDVWQEYVGGSSTQVAWLRLQDWYMRGKR